MILGTVFIPFLYCFHYILTTPIYSEVVSVDCNISHYNIYPDMIFGKSGYEMHFNIVINTTDCIDNETVRYISPLYKSWEAAETRMELFDGRLEFYKYLPQGDTSIVYFDIIHYQQIILEMFYTFLCTIITCVLIISSYCIYFRTKINRRFCDAETQYINTNSKSSDYKSL